MILSPQQVLCEYHLDLKVGEEYYLQLSPNGYQDLQVDCENKLVPIDVPLIQSVSPMYIFGNEYEQNLTIRGTKFRHEMTLQILSEWKLPIYEISSYQFLSETQVNLTVPANSFQLDRNFLRFLVNDSDIYSNALPVHVLKSINFLDVKPTMGIQGIDNVFYIVMDNFYVDLRLQCAFHTKNSWTRKPIIVDSDISMLDQRMIRCILPKNYAKRGFLSQDDEVILKVSVDGQNWVKMATLNIIHFETSEIVPSIIEQGGSKEITIHTRQLTRRVFNGQKFLCTFGTPNLTYTVAIIESDSVLKCSVPTSNLSVQNDLSLPVWISNNQDNLKSIGEVIIRKGIEVHNTSLKYLRRGVPLKMIVRGLNLDYEDLKLKYQLYDYSNNPIEEGYTQIIDRYNSSSILVLVPSLTSSLALRADFRFERTSVAIKETRAQFTILLIDTPLIEHQEQQHQFLGRLEPLVIKGMNLFQELDLDCFINGTEEIRAKIIEVNKTHLLCPLSTKISRTGQYQFMVYSHGVDLLMNLQFPVLLNIHTQPILQRTSPHFILKTHPQDLKLDLIMDQVMDAPFIKGGFVVKFEHEETGEILYSQCSFRHSNRKILECQIPEFDIIGNYKIAYSFDGGKEFTESIQTLLILDDPLIYSVSPRVSLKHTEYEITITGSKFDPRALRAVWVGQYRVSYTQIGPTQLRLKSPVISTVENLALDVKIETMYPDIFTNSQQIIFTNSLNISSSSRQILFKDTGIQNIELIGSDFKRSLNYTCLVFAAESQTVPIYKVLALWETSWVLTCPIDTSVLTKVSDDYYSLRIQLNEQLSYLISPLTVLTSPLLHHYSPEVLYSDSDVAYGLQLLGQWSYLQSLPQPIVKVQTPNNVTLDLISARYNKSAPLMFIHANVSGYEQDDVYYSVSQDGGRTWSNTIRHRLIKRPVITKFTPSYFEIENDRDEYLIGVHGLNFDPRQLECFINDKFKLRVQYFNSTYIECGWRDFQIQKRYIIGVSTNGGQQWVYSYNVSLTFMTYPRILRVYPATVPNNVETLVQLQFNKTSLHDLEYLKIRIGAFEYNMSNIQLINQTFVQIKFTPSIQLSMQSFPIRLVIDPSTDSEYDSGQVIEVGGALLYDRITNRIVYQSPYGDQQGVEILRTNLIQYQYLADLFSQSENITTLLEDSMKPSQDTISSMKCEAASNSTANITFNAKTPPKIVNVQERLILADPFFNESIFVRYDTGDQEYTIIFCRFTEESQDAKVAHSIATKKSGLILECPIPGTLRQTYQHSLSLSFDNQSFGDSYMHAVNFMPNLKLKAVTPDRILLDPLRNVRDIYVLLIQPVYDQDNLACIINRGNKSYFGDLRPAAIGNAQYFKCEIKSVMLIGLDKIGISVLYKGQKIPGGLLSQQRYYEHEIRVLPRPQVYKITPEVVINEFVPQVMTIEGSNLEWYQTVIFKHRQTHESQVISATNTLITVKMPALQKPLKEPRWMEITIVIDEDNQFTLKHKVQYFPQLKIEDFTIHEDKALIQIDRYFQDFLNITFFCTFGIAEQNSYPLRVKAIQNQNILTCNFGNLDYDSRFDTLRIEYFFGSQRQVTNTVQINRATAWQLLGQRTIHSKGILLLKQLDNQLGNLEEAYCSLNITQTNYLSKLQSFEDIRGTGYQVDQQDIGSNIFYCLLPQQVSLEADSGTVELINFADSGDTLKLLNGVFTIGSNLRIEPQPIQRVFYSYSDTVHSLEIFVKHQKNLTGIGCSLPQLLPYGISSSLREHSPGLYKCVLSVPTSIPLKSNQRDHRGESIDYMMFQLGHVWAQYQEVPVRLTKLNSFISLNRTSLLQSDCSVPFTLSGDALQGDYRIFMAEVEMRWRVENKRLAQVLTPECSEMDKIIGRAEVTVRYQNPISGVTKEVGKVPNGIQVVPHQRLAPKESFISTSKETIDVSFNSGNGNNLLDSYFKDLYCTHLFNSRKTFSLPLSINNASVECRVNLKRTFRHQNISVGLQYRDGTIISSKEALIEIKPMLLGNFTVSPQVTLCNSKIKQTLNLIFSEPQAISVLETLTLTNDTAILPKSETVATASLYLPCKRNLTYYRFNLYSNEGDVLSVGRANILTVNPFQILSIHQRNEKLYFEVDREIEFELLSKSFTIECHLGNSSKSRVQVNEFHQFYCSYEGVKVDSKQMQLKLELVRDDQSLLEIAQSFQMNMLISQQSIRAMLPKNTIMSEIEESFDIDIFTDPTTLTAIAKTQIACRLQSREDCESCNKEMYLEGELVGDTVRCFKGQLELANMSPVKVSLVFDDIEVELQGNDKLISQFVHIYDISPSTHFFIGSTTHLSLKLSHDLSDFSALNCIMVPKFSNTKYIFTALQNSTSIICPIAKQDLTEGPYWVTVGMRDSPYHLDLGKTSIQVYSRLNLTAVEPRYILTRSTDVLIHLYGVFDGLMSYYARHKQLDTIKVHLSGITRPKEGTVVYFDIYTLTNQKVTIKIKDFKELVHLQQPYTAKITIYDLEHGVKLGEIQEAITVLDPIKLVDVRPRAQFSPIEKINVTLKVSDLVNISHCIQVIDNEGTEIATNAIKLSKYEYQCLTYQDTLNISLGLQGENSQVITRISDIHIMKKKGPITFNKIEPINGPKAGGTIVNVTGQNLLNTVPFNQALLCRFGSVKVTASLVNSETIQCKTPSFSKAGPIEFSLQIQDPNDYYMVSKVIRFFYEDDIEIKEVIPSFIDLSQSMVWLEVITRDLVITRIPKGILCKIEKDIPNDQQIPSQGTIVVYGQHKSNDDHTIVCPIPTFTLSHLLKYKLTVSGNSGANYSTSLFQLKVFPILEIPGLTLPLRVQGRKQRQIIPMSHVDLLSGRFQCLFTSSNGLSYSFLGSRFNSTAVICDIYPIDTSYEIDGTLKIQDADLNLTTINAIGLNIVRDKILIKNIVPSTHVHLIPNTSLTFQIYLTEIVSPKDIKNGICRFSNEINMDWVKAPISFIDKRLLNCTLDMPQVISKEIQEVYPYLILNLQSDLNAEIFQDASYRIAISRRPIIEATYPQTLNNALEYQGKIGVVGQNFNVTSQCVFQHPPIGGEYYFLHTEYVNQSYLICNVSSNQNLRPLVQRRNFNLLVTNNRGLQYSEGYSLSFIENEEDTALKSIQIGSYYPTFGPYQGGLKLYIKILNLSNWSLQDWDNLYCDFDTVERTQLKYLNQTHRECLSPPSRYIQTVRLRVISTDVTVTVLTNHDHFYTFLADFEFLTMQPEFHLITEEDITKEVKLIGRNFNHSHNYVAVLRNESEHQTYSYELPAKQISDRELVIDLAQIKGKFNLRFKVELQIVGNHPQLTKHYPRHFYLIRNPLITLDPSNQFVRRNAIAETFISLSGDNIFVDDVKILCIFTIDGWNTSAYSSTPPLWLSTVRYGNGTQSKIQCKVPRVELVDGAVKPNLYLNLVYNDLEHLSNQVSIRVIQEAQISHFHPTELVFGRPNMVYIAGTGFDEQQSYICNYTSLQYYNNWVIYKAVQLNKTHLACNVSSIMQPDFSFELNTWVFGNEANVKIILELKDQATEHIIGQTILTFKEEVTIRLTELVPRSVYHNISDAYLDVYGSYFHSDCECLFGNVYSPSTVFVTASHLKCLVPSLQIKDRESLNRTIKGFSTRFSVSCPVTRRKSVNHLSLFIKYGTEIRKLSRSYVRENQHDTDNLVTLRGKLFYPGQTCTWRDSSGTLVEAPVKLFIDEETVVCETQGAFFRGDRDNTVELSIKEYDPQNTSIVYESNRIKIRYLPQFIIWAGFNASEEIFYLHEEEQVVNLNTNIRKHPNFTYHCLFGSDNKYISQPVYDEHDKLVGCKLPYILDESITELSLKLQEVVNDKKVSFSNSIVIRMQMLPEIEWLDPKVIPAYDNGTWIIKLNGKHFIPGQTRIFFDQLIYADVTVSSNTIGTFIAPRNIPPGILKLKITNNLLKFPRIMRNERTLEYMILPEIQSLLPTEVPTKDVPQKVIIQGVNFSSYSQCMFDGKLAVTTFLTSQLLECDAPVIFAGEEVSVRILERNLYLNRETNINLRYYASPFVYKVEPRYAFRTHEGTEVKVYVSNLHQITYQNIEFQFCKFGLYTVQVSDIKFIEDKKAKTNYTVFICNTPYHPGKEIVQVEILTDNGIFSSSINNHFEFLDPPTIKHVSPPIAPYGTKDIEFRLEGGPFDPAYEYFCQYREDLTYLNETKAFYLTNDALRCVIPGENVIRHSEYVNIRLMMKDLRQSYSYMLPGTGRVLFYDPLHIIKFEPVSGDIAGGTEVYIEGFNFDVSYGGIKCKFGDSVVQALPIENFKLIKCISPPSRWKYSTDAVLSISVDGVNYFSGEFGREVFFQYRVPPTFEAPIPIRQSVWGERTLIIFGQNFPSQERAIVICRFKFTSSKAQIDIKGAYDSESSVSCDMPRHLLVDDLIILEISFNNIDFYEVTSIENTLTSSEKARIKSIYPTFGFANATLFKTELNIEGDFFWEMQEALFGNFSRGIQLTDRTDRWLNLSIPSYVNISILDNTTTYGDNRATVEFENTIVGRSQNQLTYTYINYFKITDAYPSLVNDIGDILYLEGEGFINTPALNCRFGELFSTSVRYFNRTKIACGTPYIEDKAKRYDVGLTFNGIEYLYFQRPGSTENFSLQFTSDLYVVLIQPDLAYANELNLVINVRAQGLQDLETVSCKIHNYITRGKYFEQDGFTWIQCIIPSYDFIKATSGSVAIGLDDSFVIEVSNNGKDFSNTGKRFKYIIVEQLIEIYPTTGPEKGGTVINITVADLPNIGGESGDFVDVAKCFFPGYPPQKAQWLNINLVQCTTPLLIENIDNVTSTLSFAVAEVQVEIIGQMNAKFAFVYTKDLHITALDPYNAHIPSSQIKTPILVRGSNFLPVEDLIQCKYHFEDPILLQKQVNVPLDAVSIDDGQLIVIGRYINNHTIECMIPSLKIQPPKFNEIRMKIEISLNKGIQFTSDGLVFTYRHRDIMSYMYPTRGFTFGNTYLTIGYQYLYDKSSIRQVCNFTNVANLSESFSTRIISFDEDFVYCYTPPAYLISKTLAQLGGQVNVRISSNNRDFSDEEFLFRYDPVARIDYLTPIWIIKDREIVVSIHGEFFIQTNLLQVKLVSSDGARIAYVSQNMTEIMYQTTSLIEFVMPSDVFIEKDFVMVYLKFGEEIWYLAEQRLYIYSEVVLDRLRPNYAYVRSDGAKRELFVYGKNFWDTQKAKHLRCLLDNTESVLANYVNETLILCNVTSRSSSGTIKIDVYISPEIKSINSLYMNFIEEPVVESLNITFYYYHYQHRVPVRIGGRNLANNLLSDGTRRVYVRVDDTKIVRPIEQGSNFVDFFMPIGLNTGSYRISVSTDGLYYRPQEQEARQFRIQVLPCPPGKYCYQFTAHDCRPGYYCPQNHTFMEIKCPAGLFQPLPATQTCQRCPNGTFCKEQQLTEPKACPRGYLCDKNITISQNMMTICPDGYVCPKGTSTMDIYDVNNNPGGIQLCPNGYWCAEGSFSLIPDYGLFNSPQLCRDEVECKNELNKTTNRTTYYPGPLDQFGNNPCPRGHFCKDGIAKICPNGTYCHEEQLQAPIPCPYGQFNMLKGQTQCTLCPVGSFCMSAGTITPTKCRPGYTCQFEGAPYPAQVCPAGSYCTSMTVTNNSFSTIQAAHKPNLCSAATYCLKGASSPIVDAGNAQAAQKCQAGTYCREGTKDPNGEGKCWPGYYCPSNSPEPLPAEPGFFSQGFGNEKQEPCRAGTYQDIYGTTECKYCPRGSECPDQQMRWHQICKAGRYSQFVSQTECTKCPAGTYSNEIGIDNINKCKDCQPKFYCPEPGINSMQRAIQCQEGQYCVLRTTSEVMFTSNCWPGYYSDFRSSGLEDFFLCDPGYYCTSGTSRTKYKQNNCLQDFYCPRGTAAEISMETGKFIESKVFQVQKEDIIRAIEGLLRSTKPVVNNFDQRGLNRNYEVNYKQLTLLQSEYTNRSLAGELEKNLTSLLRQIGALWRDLDNIWWLNATYNYNFTYLQRREDYLNELRNEKECVENKILPIELRVAYFQMGKNLKCPNGTTSNRGSQCLGQCYRKQSSNIPISIMDPVNKTLKINSADESDYDETAGKTSLTPTVDPTRQLRFLQSIQPVNRTLQAVKNAFYVNDEDWINVIDKEILPEDFKSTYDYLRTYVLKPLEIAKVLLDFRTLPRNFFYNEHFAVVILDKENKIIDLPFYFDPDNNDKTNKKANLEIRVFNWREYDIEFKIAIYLYHGLFQPYLSLLKNKVNVVFYNANRQRMYSNATWAMFVSKSITEGITLPYNMPDWGKEPDFYVDMTARGSDINPVRRPIDKDVYDSTYWDAQLITANIMPWLPYFSNCEGQDQRIVLFDILEYHEKCILPRYKDIKVVNPIPSTGLDPIADECLIVLKCIYDEPVFQPIASSTRWYAIREPKDLFFITREPVGIDRIREIDPFSESGQTAYANLINDGSDELLTVTFYPDISAPGFPGVVEVNINYYQESKDIKRIAEVNVYFRNYTEYDKEDITVVPRYELQLNYQALSYFDLINTFQFSIPIYIVLFVLVSMIQILLIIIFWLFTFIFCPCMIHFKRSPSLRFTHMARVLFKQPAVGTFMANFPAMICAGLLKVLQDNTWFDNITSDWSNWGLQIDPAEQVIWKRGRLGLALIIISSVFMFYGSDTMVHRPTLKEQDEIVQDMKAYKKRSIMEMSFDDSDEDGHDKDEDIHLKEHDENITEALTWKRRHLFVNSLFIAMFFMLKIEFSYTDTFGQNIIMFQIFFAFLDIFIDQLVTRVIMGEALMTTPVTAVFTALEFVMTMGADDFQSFIVSYFAEVGIALTMRTYIGPIVEKLELKTQQTVIRLSQRFKFIEAIFRGILQRQLNMQLQLINLAEYHDERKDKRSGFKDILEKGEGMEALLGSISTYASNTQSMLLVPFILAHIILFANETKIPQGYAIAQRELPYYLTFSCIIIFPQMVIDIFLLHLLEVIWGYKVYDYFTYAEYKFRNRQKKWMNQESFARSIIHSWRSLDNMSFSQQFYYVSTLMTWGIIYLVLGMTILVRNQYNPFADPVITIFIIMVAVGTTLVRWLIAQVQAYFNIWEIHHQTIHKVDVSQVNKLDKDYSMRVLVKNLQTNPFRHKFLRVNREWLIHNIATILGGKNYLKHAGPELEFLQKIYQRAVNASEIDKKLQIHFEHIKDDLAVMPYNKGKDENENVADQISDDSISDLPVYNWHIPFQITYDHIQIIAKQWIDYAKHNMRLKEMVSDIIAKKLRPKCQRCKSVFRLQVIQKIPFNEIVKRYRVYMSGLPFTRARWRRFYNKNQIFITMCMECAYLDNLKMQEHKKRGNMVDESLIATNAVKHIGNHNMIVHANVKKKYVRNIIQFWIGIARSNLLHGIKKRAQRADENESSGFSKSQSRIANVI